MRGASFVAVVISRGSYLAILAALVAERAFELWLSNRNAQLAFARGGIELGRGQYRIIVAFHTLFMAACAAGAIRYAPAFSLALSMPALAGEAAAQALRSWSVATLGQNWNTRVIVIPGIEPVTSGPYRYIRHPNYVAVALEIACVPLIRGLVIIALAFSVGNAILLAFRIRLEEQALGISYQLAFASRPRFVPRRRF
jgi:methyltransferase